MVQLSGLYRMAGKTIALTIWTFVGKVMSLLFNTLSRFVIVFLPGSKHLSISWLHAKKHKTLKIKLKMTHRNEKISHAFGLIPVIFLKCPYDPKQSTDLGLSLSYSL